MRDVDDFHLDRLAVEDELLAVAQVCMSGEREGDLMKGEKGKFASSLARMSLRNRTVKDSHVARNIATAAAVWPLRFLIYRYVKKVEG